MNLKDVKLIVGLCDDEQYIHEEVEHLIAEYVKIHKISYELIHFYSGQELLNNHSYLDFILLDIDMPKMDGIKVGMKLRDREISYKIIMLTAKEERYREAFKIGAFRFIPKPIEKQEFFDTISEVREHLIGLNKVTVYRDGIAYSIMQKNIDYIEADRSSTLIFTKDWEYRSEQSLSAWKEILDERIFFQCHKSYLVNIGKIEEIEKNILKLVTGEKIKVSKRQRTPLLHAFMEYDTNHR